MKAALIHLRLPFSIFLAPVFFFAFSESENPDASAAVWVFILLHLLLFPASNAYNSYHDKDEGSIGLIEKPPPVTRQLLYLSLTLDLLAVALSIVLDLGWFFTVYLIVYGTVSKAYSHPAVRLKKFPVWSLLVVSFFQGSYTFVASYQTINDLPVTDVLSFSVVFPGLLCVVNLLAVYPITQVYQHAEDETHGDLTYSRLVGIKGTFVHAALCFAASFAGFGYWYITNNEIESWLLFSAFMLPTMVFFLYWWKKVASSPSEANYRNTMRLNALASLGLNIFFIILCLK